MRIANPIYDAVFKYLMEDNESAKLIISGIIGQNVEVLSFLPQETVWEQGSPRNFTVLRMDFSAQIHTKDGLKQVIIEVQKAKLATDIMRFRRYLGQQYINKDNKVEVQHHGVTVYTGIPLITIYFLGYPLDHSTAPVIKVSRTYFDLTSGQIINEKENFIESLSHDSFIVQVPYLHNEKKTELEQWLTIFDQNYAVDNEHLLSLREEDYPEKFHPLIRRLIYAASDDNIRQVMDLEDDILSEFQEYERRIAEKDQVLEDKDKALEDQKKALEDKDKLIEELMKKLET